MKLNQFTDYGLRVLMYLTERSHEPTATITELSKQFQISRNHLVKVVQFLSNQKILAAQRGRGGGLRLALPPDKIKIGQLLLLLEQTDCVINCETRNCVLAGNCLLKSALNKAYESFIHTLDEYTLKDITTGRTGAILQELSAGYKVSSSGTI